MEKIYCRLVQLLMKLGNAFIAYRTPETLEGAGCVRRLPEVLRAQGTEGVLLVTDRFLADSGLIAPLLEVLDESGIPYQLFDGAQSNPTDMQVEKGYCTFQAFVRNRQNLKAGIIAFGGGSPMDCAKAIAARAARPRKTVAQLQGLLKVRRKTPKLYAIPTTAGTGSETTVAAVITDTATHRKASINDPALIPTLAVLDPELTRSLPYFTTAITGLDALCHAIEAYTNQTYCTQVEDELARKAVRLILENLPAACADGNDLDARQQMQKAAFYAGRAFTRGCVGYVHAIGHTLSGLYGVQHGLAMSVLLVPVMRRYGTAVHKRLAELADACSLPGETDAEKANALLDTIDAFTRVANLPRGFDCIRDEDIPQMIAWARQEANPLYPVPVIWNEDDFRALIESVRLAPADQPANE